MPKFKRPWPFHFELDGKGYLYPPPLVMQILNSSAYTRDSLEWFPPRQQQANVSEAIFPPGAETGQSVTDRSRGFGHSDTHHIGSSDIDKPEALYAYTDAVDAGSSGDGQGVDASVEGVSFLGPLVNPIALPTGNGELGGEFEMTPSGGVRTLFVVMGNRVHKSVDGVTWEPAIEFGAVELNILAPLTGRPIVFQGTQVAPRVYFPRGKDEVFIHWDGTGTQARSAAAVSDNNKWIDCIIIDDQVFVLWYDTATLKYRVSSFEDGTASGPSNTPTYSPSIAVSDGSDPALCLLTAHNTLYIGCTNSLRSLNAERTALFETIWHPPAPSSDNFKWWNQWRDELWFTAGQGEYRILKNGAFEAIGPETNSGNRTPVQGVVRAKVGDDFCMYQFLRTNDGITYLVKFRYYEDGARSAHHVISRIGAYDINHAFISTIDGVNPRLFFGVSTTELRSIILPRNGLYPPADENCQFCEKGYLFDTRMHGQLYFVNKSLFAHTTRAQDLSSTALITNYYRTDTVPNFTQFGTESLDTDPGERVELVTPVLCAWWEGRTKLERGTDASVTPLLLASTWNFNYRPVAKAQYTVYAWAVDDATLRGGGRIKDRTPADMLDDLEALDSSPDPVTFMNAWSQYKRVFVNEVRVIDYTQEADQESQGVVKITLIEFADQPFSTGDTMESLTWDEAEAYTYDELEARTWE